MKKIVAVLASILLLFSAGAVAYSGSTGGPEPVQADLEPDSEEQDGDEGIIGKILGIFEPIEQFLTGFFG